MELKDIKKVVQMMSENELTEFVLEEGEFKLALKRGCETQFVHAAPVAASAVAPVAAPAAAPAAPAEAAASAADEGLVEITSPIVGTFYRSPSPDADAFVKEGDSVDENTVVCIVEAMKVMNEIKAELRGTIKKVLVDNASPIQFGQPLFLVDPA